MTHCVLKRVYIHQLLRFLTKQEEIMFSRGVFVALSFMVTFLRTVSSCDYNCTYRPYFIPSRLVVKHGDSTSAACHLCSSCQDNKFMLEFPAGEDSRNGTVISWTSPKMTEWGRSVLCHYSITATDKMCCSELPVTVYKPPDSVSIGFANHSGQLYEARQYTLQCKVHNVGPVRYVKVTFYRGSTVLERLPAKNSVNEARENVTYTLNVNASKEDDGVQYRCEAKLELGSEGPQKPPMMTSQTITATVHYKPQRQDPTPPDQITVTQGDTLQMNCTAEGNPHPSYSWRFLPASLPLSNNSVLTIKSAAFAHQGNYTCSVSNGVGTLDVNFNVVVKANIIPYIAIATAVVLVVIVGGVVHWYRHSRRGQYNLRDVFHLNKPHIAVPTAE
ncbi:vascular cell adhesion 1-like [Solea senegalensis]|uniref:Vascular cell adhesion 1-like n=1 Tax=Solea senegalensis TaxID=28829 RepID=A0AAV6QB16_SOLSE|nr:vascular cell adhesion protein 1-like [Solea senegalensis]KAG7485663.1 vascular cell adhesion 1-like [Solea senegalensis]